MVLEPASCHRQCPTGEPRWMLTLGRSRQYQTKVDSGTSGHETRAQNFQTYITNQASSSAGGEGRRESVDSRPRRVIPEKCSQSASAVSIHQLVASPAVNRVARGPSKKFTRTGIIGRFNESPEWRRSSPRNTTEDSDADTVSIGCVGHGVTDDYHAHRSLPGDGIRRGPNDV